MDLWLVRHGIAVDRTAPDCPPDEARPLTPKGIRRTDRVAAGLARLEVRPQWVLSSPLVRARQTAERIVRALDVPPRRLRETASLRPSADPAALLAELEKLRATRVLCVGHAPHLDRVLGRLVGSPSPFTSLGKAGAAALEVTRFEPGGAELQWVLPPRALRLLGN